MSRLMIAQHVKQAPAFVFDGWLVHRVDLRQYLTFVATQYDATAWAAAGKGRA